MLQTILGSGGAIGVQLAKELSNYTDQIRLVSRNPHKVNPGDELRAADLSDTAQVDKAISGSAIVYVVIGFEYKVSVWLEKWPPFMRNVITACKEHNAKLVFFDNVYMYDRDDLSNMTEDTPVRPTSKKGMIRAELVKMIFDEVNAGSLTALIARAADFIGDKNSVLVEMVYKNLAKGKKANWFLDADKIHSFTFTPDAAKATALLGNTADAYNRVWHLPTSPVKLTGKQWIQLFADELKVKPRYSTMPIWMMSIAGVFVPVLKEFKEMAYQYDRDYFFNSSKFQQRFGFEPTSPQDAVRWIIQNVKP
jgi:nucleoside-diphosphate-sugar epimerase